MEDSNYDNGLTTESQVLNVSTPQEGKVGRRRSRKSSNKWIILVLIAVIAVVPALYILFKSSGGATQEKSYEECVKECVSLKDTGEIDVPYGNCFEYCREDVPTP